MNDNQLETQLARFLAEGPLRAPARLATSAAAFAVEHPRARRDWRSLFAGAGTLVRPAPVALRPLVLLALLAVTFAFGAFVYAAWHNNTIVPPQPTPTPNVPPSPSPTTQPSPAAFACPARSLPDEPGLIAQPRPEARVLVFDSLRGQILSMGSGWDAPSDIWRFDVCNNLWQDSGISVESLASVAVYDRVSDAVLVARQMTGDTPIVHAIRYVHLSSGVATDVPLISTGHLPVAGAYRAASDEIVALVGGPTPWSYDQAAAAWVELSSLGDAPPDDALIWGAAYDESLDRLIVYATGPWRAPPPAGHSTVAWAPRTYEYDFASATWLRGDDPPDLTYGGWGHQANMVFDGAHERTVLVSGNLVAGYDSTDHAWQTLHPLGPDAGPQSIYAPIVYDPLNRRVVAVDGDQATWAFDLETRSWIVLLEPPLQ